MKHKYNIQEIQAAIGHECMISLKEEPSSGIIIAVDVFETIDRSLVTVEMDFLLGPLRIRYSPGFIVRIPYVDEMRKRALWALLFQMEQ